MSISEAARHDLHTGLVELLGSKRAETLMAHLPRYDPVDVATKADFADLRTEVKADINVVKSDIADLRTDTKNRFDSIDRRFEVLDERLDRFFLTQVAGVFVVVLAVAVVVFATL